MRAHFFIFSACHDECAQNYKITHVVEVWYLLRRNHMADATANSSEFHLLIHGGSLYVVECSRVASLLTSRRLSPVITSRHLPGFCIPTGK